jgi:hypothetical protein
VTDGAAELGLVEPTLACLLDSQQSDVSGVIAAYGGGSHVRLSNVALDGGPDGMTLIRSLSQALIECSDQVQSPSGTTTGIAQDASGAGKILWDHQPALTGAIADLAVDLATGSNSLLATAPSILEDAITGLSWIARSTTLGATPDLPGTNGSILVRVANPATGLILAAPPAGFMNLVLLAGQNAAAALTLTFRVRDADGLQFTQGATPLAAATAAFLSTGFPLVVTSDLNADVSGGTGGTPCEFRGSYIQVRIPHGMVRAAVVLTSAYQSIPVVPASGLVAGYTIVPSYESANQGIVVVNGDSATCTPQFRLTRGATVFAWNAPVTAIGARLAPIPVMPLQAGDVLEVKLAVAPVVAGTIILRALYVPVGAAA